MSSHKGNLIQASRTHQSSEEEKQTTEMCNEKFQRLSCDSTEVINAKAQLGALEEAQSEDLLGQTGMTQHLQTGKNR